jgi:hypothetical protein
MSLVDFILKRIPTVFFYHAVYLCIRRMYEGIYGRDSWEAVFDNFVQEITVYNTELVSKFH